MVLSQNKKFSAAVFEPLLGFVRVGCEAAGQRPERAAVVSVGEVAEFVYADIVGNVFRCADQPPVEAYACGFAAHAPEGFGRGQRGGGGEQLCCAGVVFEAGKQVALSLPFQKCCQQCCLFVVRVFGNADFRRHQQDLRVLMGGEGKLSAVEPDMFGQPVGRIVRRCFRQCSP